MSKSTNSINYLRFREFCEETDDRKGRGKHDTHARREDSKVKDLLNNIDLDDLDDENFDDIQ